MAVQVRGLAVSATSPYLFSAAEDKTVKCWDLEQNKVSPTHSSLCPSSSRILTLLIWQEEYGTAQLCDSCDWCLVVVELCVGCAALPRPLVGCVLRGAPPDAACAGHGGARLDR
eukprot:COSAG05_NODE_6733_length_912_cov_0.788438_1_plen_113_part_10